MHYMNTITFSITNSECMLLPCYNLLLIVYVAFVAVYFQLSQLKQVGLGNWCFLCIVSFEEVPWGNHQGFSVAGSSPLHYSFTQNSPELVDVAAVVIPLSYLCILVFIHLTDECCLVFISITFFLFLVVLKFAFTTEVFSDNFFCCNIALVPIYIILLQSCERAFTFQEYVR